MENYGRCFILVSIVTKVLSLTVSVQLSIVTDGQTDRISMAKTTLMFGIS